MEVCKRYVSWYQWELWANWHNQSELGGYCLPNEGQWIVSGILQVLTFKICFYTRHNDRCLVVFSVNYTEEVKVQRMGFYFAIYVLRGWSIEASLSTLIQRLGLKPCRSNPIRVYMEIFYYFSSLLLFGCLPRNGQCAL